MEQSLDKLRDKTLSFGCMIYSSRHGLGYILGEETLFFMKGEKIVRGYECPNIIGHPLTRGRLCYLTHIHKLRMLDKKHALKMCFAENTELYDQDETQRMKHEERPELKKLLEEFVLLIPEGHNATSI